MTKKNKRYWAIINAESGLICQNPKWLSLAIWEEKPRAENIAKATGNMITRVVEIILTPIKPKKLKKKK